MSARPSPSRRSSIAIASAVTLTCLALAGCESNSKSVYQPNLVKYQEDVGPVTFAVTSVTPWDEVASELQPTFEMNEAKALAEIAPNTMYFDEQRFRSMALRSGLALGAPTLDTENKTEKITGTKDGAEDKTTATSTVKETSAPTAAPTFTPATIDRATAVFSNPDIGTEPTLRYQMATALLQYVRLSSRYIKDSIEYGKYIPYVIRFQVGVMPVQRNMPYDTYVDVALYPTQSKNVTITPPSRDGKTKGNPIRIEAQVIPPPTPSTSSDKENKPITTSDDTQKRVLVVPLLNMDSVEGLMQARSNEQVREIALSFAAALQGVGGRVEANDLLQTFQRVLGRDLNSVASIGVRENNILRIRLGALQQPTSQYGIVPRQQTVSAVVLVHKDYEKSNLSALAMTKYVNAQDGTELPNQPKSRLYSKIRNTLWKYRPSSGLSFFDSFRWESLSNDEIERLIRLVSSGSQAGLSAFLSSEKLGLNVDAEGDDLPSNVNLTKLWIELTALINAENSQQVTVSLQKSAPAVQMPPPQRAFLMDDGKQAVLSLRNGRKLQYTTAWLEAKPTLDNHKDENHPSANAVFPVARQSLDNDTAIQLLFPSLAQADVPKTILDTDQLVLRVTSKDSNNAIVSKTYDISYKHVKATPPQSPAGLEVLAVSVSLATKELLVSLKAPTDGEEYFLSVKGARIDKPALETTAPAGTQLPLTRAAESWQITRTGRCILKLTDLPAAESTLEIRVIDKDAAVVAKPQTVTVKP